MSTELNTPILTHRAQHPAAGGPKTVKSISLTLELGGFSGKVDAKSDALNRASGGFSCKGDAKSEALFRASTAEGGGEGGGVDY